LYSLLDAARWGAGFPQFSVATLMVRSRNDMRDSLWAALFSSDLEGRPILPSSFSVLVLLGIFLRAAFGIWQTHRPSKRG
jgi:hypothetical protein